MKHRLQALIGIGILLTSLVLGGSSVSAQDQLPACTLSVPLQTHVVFGDSLTAVLAVSVPSGDRVSEPAAESVFSDLSGRIAWRDSTLGQSIDQYRFGLTLYAFTLDTLTVGPLTVHVSGVSDTTLTSNTLILPVSTVLAEADTIPLPNRSPLTISGWWIPSWVPWIGILLLIAITVGVWLYFRKRRPVEVSPVILPVNEMDLFLDIKRQALHEHGKFKELYIHLSDALRGFIHRNMATEAMYETTTEITAALRRTSYDQSIIETFITLLTEADQVKFAKYVPPYPEVASAVDRAIESVRTVLDENERRLRAETQAAVVETTNTGETDDDANMVQTVEGGD